MVSKIRRAYSKRNRPIKSCSECTRRKQKCDRNLPCQSCRARGVENQCSYGMSYRSPALSADHASTIGANSSSPLTTRNTMLASVENGESLSTYIGYSQVGDHALSTLNHLLENQEESPGRGSTSKPQSDERTEKMFSNMVALLPTATLTQSLVQIFFDEANWYFAVLDRYFFDINFVQWNKLSAGEVNINLLTQEMFHFPALLFQVLGLALQFLPSDHPCERKLLQEYREDHAATSDRFSEHGERLMGILGRRNPTITSVQADLMRCAWLKNNGRGAEAWYSLSSATRQAQEIGLHIQSNQLINTGDVTSETLRAIWLDEHKRRLWATLFIWESHMSLQLGRPRLIHVSDCTFFEPIDCDFPIEPSRTLYRRLNSDEPPSSFTLQLVKYRISHVIHRMMSMGATNPLLQNYGVIESLHDHVSQLLSQLPSAMQLENPDKTWDVRYPGLMKQRLQISIVVYSFLVALHRPHASQHDTSRHHATEAAIRSLDASHQLFLKSEPHHHKIYTLMFYTIDSGIFLAATALKFHTEDSDTRHRAYQTLQQAVERLGVLKQRNSSARHGQKVLAKCVEKFQQAWMNPIIDTESYTGMAHIGSATMSSSTPSLTTRVGTTIAALEHDPLLGRDLFEEITNARVSTTSWLEHMDMMSRLDFRFDESDSSWDNFLQ